MVSTDNWLLGALGFRVTGDLGPWTFYTSASKSLVFFPRMPAKEPASPAQITQREKFATAGAQWAQLSEEKRREWERAARRAGVRATGYNLFTYLVATGRKRTIQTIERQSGIALLT